jgi:hypothetical protein
MSICSFWFGGNEDKQMVNYFRTKVAYHCRKAVPCGPLFAGARVSCVP